MRFWHLNMTLQRLRSNEGTLRHFDCPKCFLLLPLKVFRGITLKYLHDSNSEYGDAAV